MERRSFALGGQAPGIAHEAATVDTPDVPVRTHDRIMMRVKALLSLFALLAAGCLHSAPPRSPDEATVDAVAAFRAKLQAELKQGMTLGPEQAIAVCRERAPRIAVETSTKEITLGRTSTRLRNPANAPRPWLEPILADYAEHADQRSPRTVALSNDRIGYAEPIVIQPLCLVCHGETPAPAVADKLRELYPQDRATGYRDGEFRGVFWAETIIRR